MNRIPWWIMQSNSKYGQWDGVPGSMSKDLGSQGDLCGNLWWGWGSFLRSLTQCRFESSATESLLFSTFVIIWITILCSFLYALRENLLIFSYVFLYFWKCFAAISPPLTQIPEVNWPRVDVNIYRFLFVFIWRTVKYGVLVDVVLAWIKLGRVNLEPKIN